MKGLWHRIGEVLGIDKSIAYTSFTRILQAIGGIVTALLIVRFLTGVEQGFYYTFGSILAVQTFFELGMNGIITQYVAHEASHLEWNGSGFNGPVCHQSRLSSLLHFCFRWYGSFALVLFVLLMVVGFLFFNRYDTSGGQIHWQLPWIVLASSTSINLLLAPMFSYLEGLGRVKQVARYRFFQTLLGLFLVWISFALGAGLLTAGINSLTWALVALAALLFTPFGCSLRSILRIPITTAVSYRREIFPYQWKIALSWISGYFIFQLFNPVLFANEGAVAAGQMGMTLAALTAIQALSYSWTSTKVPRYASLIAGKQWQALDTLFAGTLRRAIWVNIACLLLFFLTVSAIRYFHITIFGLYLGDRFLSPLPLILMMIPELCNQFVTAWATYLRCHKQEPYLVNSIVTGIACALSTIGLGYLYGTMGITMGYCAITLAITPWAYYIFTSKRTLWHQPYSLPH